VLEGTIDRRDPAYIEVWARAVELWTPEVARVWMTSPNAHLGGAVPATVVMQRGPSEVLTVLAATRAGAYA
jgi:uncharacterized protein (DUF2384 family)